MEQSKNGLARMRNAKSNLRHLIRSDGSGAAMTRQEESQLKQLEAYREKFDQAMDDDLNTADAISVVFELIKDINTYVREGATGAFAERCLALLDELAGVLGLLQQEQEEGIDPAVKQLVQERQAARKAKDFKRADEIRDQLKAQGYILEDTPQGVKITRA